LEGAADYLDDDCVTASCPVRHIAKETKTCYKSSCSPVAFPPITPAFTSVEEIVARVSPPSSRRVGYRKASGSKSVLGL